MEPSLQTAPALLGVLEELRRREPIFHRAEFGTAREDFERMTTEDFWEVGASGQRYSRAHVLDVLATRRHDGSEEADWQTQDFRCQQIAADTYLLTYTLLQPERRTRRATLWRRTADGWKIVYHQGTVVSES
ncbi:hypothetical protein QE400_003018 [Xanthomonas sacchari]|uniref:nuclear transport factor 2 family protein n=1 Tax=Xanthomonas sacchari TaxID=56458 RepID=UPI00278055E7|nr:DUF4440 domain-containing protein [Xanthomonas sacchari]MDQ1093605.1 hypothetical protein [Xanthomonas sacchari]